MTHYQACPNGCDGEVPLIWDGGLDGGAVIDEAENARSHDPECPPLTDEQREALMDAATLVMSDPGWWADTRPQPIELASALARPAIPVVAVYADGGVIERNPSPIGGTWAWCSVGRAGLRISGRGGVVPAGAEGLAVVSNNHMEFLALLNALEALPDGWSGRVCSDSQVSLGRLFWSWKLTGLPRPWIERGAAAIKRLGTCEPVLLQGHPTKADLARGIGAKRSYPVSEHNVWCDAECGRQAAAYLARTRRSVSPVGVSA